MLILFWIWVVGGLTSLISYAAVSFCYDRCFVTSTWIKLWLSVMVLLGPVGSLLTIRTLSNIIKDVRTEMHRLAEAGESVLKAHPIRRRTPRALFSAPAASMPGTRD